MTKEKEMEDMNFPDYRTYSKNPDNMSLESIKRVPENLIKLSELAPIYFRKKHKKLASYKLLELLLKHNIIDGYFSVNPAYIEGGYFQNDRTFYEDFEDEVRQDGEGILISPFGMLLINILINKR
ncbi:hypothetical protein FEDK69T_07980 [Flavobacterium enshiense DK69]|uniref:Uncharacterized protein n=1 Tax=Flavobacterium enshiense DK69 TaxID=1107311 RepID=V6SCF5_9FLAO|nr:hypothetical protein [Flavobacterium enshiense]ESU24353.1 hypothetical protein FEDK69T_07980 [Flavobacterium enshiense DK69]KGO94458.1 hypothetical protein Q767_12880 [Flavobacterium enshiense DK69]